MSKLVRIQGTRYHVLKWGGRRLKREQELYTEPKLGWLKLCHNHHISAQAHLFQREESDCTETIVKCIE